MLNSTTSAQQQAINPAAPLVARDSISIQAPLACVWALLTGIDAWPRWNSEIARASIQGPLAPGTAFRWKTGGAAIHSQLHTVAPMTALGWTGRTFGMYAIHNWHLAQVGDAVVVQVEESMEGLLARLFKKAFQKYLEQGMAHWLQALKAAAEASQ
jgi:uncharacterized protein YndB with AHSA1/START domain